MNTALIVVDMQTSLIDEGPWNSECLIDTIDRLVQVARQRAATIVYVTDRRVEPDMSLHPRFQPLAGELCIEKDFCDSFLGTSLDNDLRERGIRRLVIAGLQTDYCIDTTCRRAASLGYTVHLVRDGHSTFPHDSLTAEQIVAHHNRIFRRFAAAEGSVSVHNSEQIQFT